MKKILFSTITIALLTTAVSTTAFSQTSEIAYHKTNNFPDLGILTASREKPVGMVKVNAVGEKIQNAFNKSFTDATDVSWYTINNNKRVLAVYFYYNGRYSRAAYTKNGGMLYSIIQASEKLLPKEDRHAIKSNYVDYEITNVLEINSENRKVWITNLQNEDNIVIVRTEDGTLDELVNYKRKLESKKQRR
ncbi:MAG: hypothetical protein ICV79_25585, partial [Flavisolibacter sp.]|nr:hypothetical protein [Flavisolibacter sp.]